MADLQPPESTQIPRKRTNLRTYATYEERQRGRDQRRDQRKIHHCGNLAGILSVYTHVEFSKIVCWFSLSMS